MDDGDHERAVLADRRAFDELYLRLRAGQDPERALAETRFAHETDPNGRTHI